MKYEFKTNYIDFIQYFGISEKRSEELEDYINEYPRDVFYDYVWDEVKKAIYTHDRLNLNGNEMVREIADDYFMEHCEFTGDIRDTIVDECLLFIERQVQYLFDDNLKNFNCNYENDIVTWSFEGDSFKVCKMGMDGMGEFDWDLHSKEDKKSFSEDGELVLREIMHYYLACEGKPNIKLDRIDSSRYCNIPSIGEVVNYVIDFMKSSKCTIDFEPTKEQYQILKAKTNISNTVSMYTIKHFLPEFEDKFDESWDNCMLVINVKANFFN